MNFIDWILIIIIVALCALAVFTLRQNARSGKDCTGNCASCGHTCRK